MQKVFDPCDLNAYTAEGAQPLLNLHGYNTSSRPNWIAIMPRDIFKMCYYRIRPAPTWDIRFKLYSPFLFAPEIEQMGGSGLLIAQDTLDTSSAMKFNQINAASYEVYGTKLQPSFFAAFVFRSDVDYLEDCVKTAVTHSTPVFATLPAGAVYEPSFLVDAIRDKSSLYRVMVSLLVPSSTLLLLQSLYVCNKYYILQTKKKAAAQWFSYATMSISFSLLGNIFRIIRGVDPGGINGFLSVVPGRVFFTLPTALTVCSQASTIFYWNEACNQIRHTLKGEMVKTKDYQKLALLAFSVCCIALDITVGVLAWYGTMGAVVELTPSIIYLCCFVAAPTLSLFISFKMKKNINDIKTDIAAKNNFDRFTISKPSIPKSTNKVTKAASTISAIMEGGEGEEGGAGGNSVVKAISSASKSVALRISIGLSTVLPDSPVTGSRTPGSSPAATTRKSGATPTTPQSKIHPAPTPKTAMDLKASINIASIPEAGELKEEDNSSDKKSTDGSPMIVKPLREMNKKTIPKTAMDLNRTKIADGIMISIARKMRIVMRLQEANIVVLALVVIHILLVAFKVHRSSGVAFSIFPIVNLLEHLSCSLDLMIMSTAMDSVKVELD
jgi:hypothetical protein